MKLGGPADQDKSKEACARESHSVVYVRPSVVAVSAKIAGNNSYEGT